MAVKCTISDLAIQKLNFLLWGINCDMDEVDKGIIRNYLEYLDCPTSVLESCLDSDCVNDPVIVDCVGIIAEMSRIEGQPSDVMLSFIGSSPNAAAPYTCEWVFDAEYFDLLDSNNPCQLNLQLKPDVSLERLNTKIQLTITDAVGCQKTITCTSTPALFTCDTSYELCPNPMDLVVTEE